MILTSGLKGERNLSASDIFFAKKATLFFFACAAPFGAAYAVDEPSTKTAMPLLCPASFPAGALQDKNPEHQRRDLMELAALAEVCDARPDFHAYRGALLLSLDRAQDAAISLEKALLLDPNLAGVQIDYAQALGRIGQHQPAQDLVNQVTQRPDIEPQLKQWLLEAARSGKPHRQGAQARDGAQADEHAVMDDRWVWAGRLQAMHGREANLSGASHTTVLPLYLNSGIVEVALTDSERPKAGHAAKYLAFISGARPLADGFVRWTTVLQSRHTPSETTLKSENAESRLTYSRDTLIGRLSGTFGLSAYRQTTLQSYKDTSYRIEYQPNWRISDCKEVAYAGRTFQRHTVNQENNGNDGYAGLEWVCGSNPDDLRPIANETLLSIHAGRFKPLSLDRPGGMKRRTQIQLQHSMALYGLGGLGRYAPPTLSLFGRWSRVRDEKIISVLFGPEPTLSRRADIGLAYWHPIHNQWSVGLEFEHGFQRSNNKLLEIKNRSAYAGIRWAFR